MAKSKDFRQENLYLKHPIEEYAFSKCINGEKDELACRYPDRYKYELNNLPLYQQLALAEYVGFLRDAGWNQKKRSIRFDVQWSEQLDFFENSPYLNEGVDFEISSIKDHSYSKRQTIHVHNPIICNFYDTPLIPIRKDVKAHLLAGIFSNAILRSQGKPNSQKKVVTINRILPIARQLRELSSLRQLHYSPWDYTDVNKGNLKDYYSTWFYRPEEILEGELYIPSFGIENYLENLPHYEGDQVLDLQLQMNWRAQSNVRRFLKRMDPVPYCRKQLKDELKYAQQALEKNEIHPDHLDKMMAICNLKTDEEMESKDSEENGKKIGRRIQRTGQNWKNERAYAKS